MSKAVWGVVLAVGAVLTLAAPAGAQTGGGVYIGYAYPAGGRQGTTFRVKLGGQNLSGVDDVIVSGRGVTGRVVDYYRKLSPQDVTLLSEQLRDLRRSVPAKALAKLPPANDTMTPMMVGGDEMMMSSGGGKPDAMEKTPANAQEAALQLVMKIQKRLYEYVLRPASVAISTLVFVEVTIAPDAPPGQRELRLVTPHGVSNPLVFYVGQLPELTRAPMRTSEFQVLGKEALALRRRPDTEQEQRITVPCVANGQIASGEVNQYRFEARKGQKLVISAAARDLIPFIADAVPGWFQPVMAVQDANGKQLAYCDDYRFKPDPIIFFEVPKDGEYTFTITDAIYRGREDFVYRVTIGEMPFVTSIFPLGARVGTSPEIAIRGSNVDGATISAPKDAQPGVYRLAASKGGVMSNAMPFEIDTLPECMEKSPNNDIAHAQKVRLPMIVNGRIDRADEWDVYQFDGKAGQTIVAEVTARRLESPLDSVLKLTDASGKVLAYNDDHEDLEAGANTHDADSYIRFALPADGVYYIHIGDTARKGGEEYAYRLRISEPRPDFALRLAPSSIFLRRYSSSAVSVFVSRKDGFASPVKLSLKNPPKGVTATPMILGPAQTMVRLSIKAERVDLKEPFNLVVQGTAIVGKETIAHDAVPAEDRMQAFLWRHLVAAQEFKAEVLDPATYVPKKRTKRVTVATSQPATKPATGPATALAGGKSKFTKQQVAQRLKQVEMLFDEGLLTEAFRQEKIAECEVAQ